MIKKEISKLMRDDSDGTAGREALLDYELSWVMRMAADAKCPPKLKHQCRCILFKLLGIENCSNIEIVKVQVWKQWRNVDLIADVFLAENDVVKLHVLLIENKAYTMMKENQRDQYPILIREDYDTMDKYREYRDYVLHQVLVTCYDSDSPQFSNLSDFVAKGNGWTVHSIGDLPDINVDEMTESDLFNEFWLMSW